MSRVAQVVLGSLIWSYGIACLAQRPGDNVESVDTSSLDDSKLDIVVICVDDNNTQVRKFEFEMHDGKFGSFVSEGNKTRDIVEPQKMDQTVAQAVQEATHRELELFSFSRTLINTNHIKLQMRWQLDNDNNLVITRSTTWKELQKENRVLADICKTFFEIPLASTSTDPCGPIHQTDSD